MRKMLAGKNDCNIFDEVFFENKNIINGIVDLACQKSSKQKTLSSEVRYVNSFDFNTPIINDELSDKKVYQIAKELAQAIDKNSVVDIKRLKYQYASTKEFARAKEFLNKKCKQVWDVFENKSEKIKIPKDAMKSLGISNKPTLEFLLDESIKFYEKDNGSTTVDIICSILKNPNIDYTFEEIFEYLSKKHTKEKCKYNLITVKYLAQKLDYDSEKLNSVGADKTILKRVFNLLSLKEKITVLINNINYLL